MTTPFEEPGRVSATTDRGQNLHRGRPWTSTGERCPLPPIQTDLKLSHFVPESPLR